MSCLTALLALLAFPGPAPPAPENTAADVVTLRDGRTVAGERIVPWNPGSVGLYVRRAWVRQHLPDWADRWEAAEAPTLRRASVPRLQRLEAWRRERAAASPPRGDRISLWIDGELAKLRDDAPAARPPLLIARLALADVRSVRRAARGSSRLLRLGWVCGFPHPESTPIGDLRDGLEGRGFDPASTDPVPIDRLLPPRPETESSWLIRRAATEVLSETDLHFLRYQGLVMPDTGTAPMPNQGDLATQLSILRSALGPEAVDPLPARLRAIEQRGRVGALVTSLDVAPDLSIVTVTLSLWVRQGPDRWAISGARTARVRPDDLGPEAGKDLADDPRVAGAFQVAEALGLGQALQEVKQRSLSVGAATRKALALAKKAANDDLERSSLMDFP